jgi:hypothetical protein
MGLLYLSRVQPTPQRRETGRIHEQAVPLHLFTLAINPRRSAAAGDSRTNTFLIKGLPARTVKPKRLPTLDQPPGIPSVSKP